MSRARLLPALLLTLILCPAVLAQGETATVFFYRLEEAPKLNSGRPKVYLNDKHIFSIPENEYVGIKVTPGKHVLRMVNKQTAIPFEAKAGETYYIRVSEVINTFSFVRGLFPVPAEQGVLHIRDLRPLQDKNVKDKKLEVVKEKPETRNAQTPY